MKKQLSLRRLRGQEDINEELESLLKIVKTIISPTTIVILDGNDISLDLDIPDRQYSPVVINDTYSNAQVSKHQLSIWELVRSKPLIRPLWIAISCQMAQKLSGIGTALFYSTVIFAQIYSQKQAVRFTSLIISVDLIMTFICLNLIERLGRRTLLLLSGSIMGRGALLTFISGSNGDQPFFVVVSLMLFMAGFGLGLGSIPW